MKKLITILIFSWLAVSPVRAQSPTASDADLDLTIFPPTAYLTVQPGSTMEHKVVIKHNGTEPIAVTPQLVDFVTDGLTGTPQLRESTRLTYIRIQNLDKDLGKPFVIQPRQQIELTLEIKPPSHEANGEHPLALVLTAQPTTTVTFDGSSAQAAGAVVSNVIISLQRDLDNLGRLEVGKINLPHVIDSFSQLEFEIIALNSGRNAVAAEGEISLKHGWSNRELKHWFIHQDVVLAENTRALRGVFLDPTEIPPDEEPELKDFNYKPPFLIGPYQVEVNLTSANRQHAQTVSTSRQVWAFPFSLIGAVLVGILIYFGYEKWQQKEAKKL